MENIEPNIEITQLLPRYCEGTTTENENREIEQWINESEENEKIFNQINTIHLMFESIEIDKAIDIDKDFLKVKQRILPRKTFNLWTWTQRIAVVMFIPLLLFSLYGWFGQQTSNIQMMEVKSNSGMTTKLLLPDGTTVYLNSNSVLRYPTQFANGENRAVDLEGEAYFEVTKSKDRFIVNTIADSKIEVLGTKFNIEAYDDTPYIITSVVEGCVAFDYNVNHDSGSVVLRKGDQSVYNIENNQCELFKTNGSIDIAWKDNKIILNNTPLDKTLRLLEKYYDVKFVIENESLKNNSFTGTFKNQRLERILEFMYLTTDIKWKETKAQNNSERRIIEIY